MDIKKIMNMPMVRWIIASLLLVLATVLYKYFSFIPQDNFIEERVEEIIEDNLEIELDLSPESDDGNE